MRIFVTGATGYVGGAVARALADAGHEVVALARSAGADKELRDAGYATVEALVLDQQVASRNTRELVGWSPREAGILEVPISDLA